MSDRPDRDIDKEYAKKDFIAKLRRLANALEQNKPFKIQVAGERITVPADVRISVEHERSDDEEEIEFQLTWQRRIKRADEDEDEEEDEDDEDDEETQKS
jgi:amphi-Trp domain-containing protein